MDRKYFHWGPILAFCIIKSVTWTTIHCTVQWLPLHGSMCGLINGFIFCTLAFLTIYNFLCAISYGPGFVPHEWHPRIQEHERYLQFCVTCKGFKAPRSHHCRKCGRCVLKMDHHCPWINNCVGHLNHGYFIMFLLFAVVGSIHSFVLLLITIYKFVSSTMYYSQGLAPPVRLSLVTFISCIFSIGISLGVFIALSFLLTIQIKAVIKNCTGIEDWILEKAEERRNIDPTLSPFEFPYNLGWKENIRLVFHEGFSPAGNGVIWKVKSGCSEYDLTIEQIKQKELKKLRKKPFRVVKRYSGAIFPLDNGFCTFCRPPCQTESRMALNVDEIVLVTRFHKYWVFGEKGTDKMQNQQKGWFPKSCIVSQTELKKE